MLAKAERRKTSEFLSAMRMAISQYIESQETKTRKYVNGAVRQVSPGYLHHLCCGLQLLMQVHRQKRHLKGPLGFVV